MKSLQQIWEEMPLKSDKGDVHSYIDVYEQLLRIYRGSATNILEIGLFNGASLLMWEQYFSGNVYGIDCDNQPHGGMADLRPLINRGTHNILIGDATNAAFVHDCFNGIKFNIIIEDAAHNIEQQLKLYEVFKPYLATNSLYIIEDIQDIDATGHLFENIDSDKNVVIFDLRSLKLRYDDVLIIIKDKA